MKVKHKANVIAEKMLFLLFLSIFVDLQNKTKKHDVSFRFKRFFFEFQ